MTVKQNNNNRINEALGEIVQYHIHAGIYILTNTLLFTRRMSGQLLVAQFHQQGIQRALQWVICLCKRFSQRRKGCRMWYLFAYSSEPFASWPAWTPWRPGRTCYSLRRGTGGCWRAWAERQWAGPCGE